MKRRDPPVSTRFAATPAILAARRRYARATRRLVIETGDSPERWNELFRIIEDLARCGHRIDCSRPPGAHRASSPLRGAVGKR